MSIRTCRPLLLAPATVLLGLTTVQAWAQESAATGQYKIGIVDRKKVFDDYHRKKTEFAKIEAEVKQVQTEIDAATKTIVKQKEDYDANQASMSDEARSALERDIRKAVEEQQFKLNQQQDEINSRQARLIKELTDEINAAIAKVGVEEEYHIIFEGDKRSKSSVIYFSARMDITSKIIDRLNSEKK